MNGKYFFRIYLAHVIFFYYLCKKNKSDTMKELQNKRQEPRTFIVKVRRLDESGEPIYRTYCEEHIPFVEILSITTSQGDASNKGAVLTTRTSTYQTKDTFKKVFESIQEQVGEECVVKQDGVACAIVLDESRIGLWFFGEKSQQKGLLAIEPIRELNGKTKTVIFEGGHTISLTNEDDWNLLIRINEKMSRKYAKWARDSEFPNTSLSTYLNYTKLVSDYRSLNVKMTQIQEQLRLVGQDVSKGPNKWLLLYRVLVLILLILIFCKMR